jgi:hypothetical protein
MNKAKQLGAIFAFATVVLFSCDKDDDNYTTPPPPPIQSTVIAIAGDSVTVAGKLADLRTLLGDQVNNTPTQTPTGRREVNWDGTPPQFSHINPFPLDFFNDLAGPNGRKRGLQYAAGSVLRVDSTDFFEIDASYAAQFEPFSRKRLIISVGSNITDVEFRVAGTTTPASVKGFGVIFSDVDNPNSTYIEFFNGTKSLGVFKAPAAAGSGKFSLLGVSFATEKITKLRITSGTAALANNLKDVTDGGGNDLVAMDDFFYSEPLQLQ